MATKLTYRVFTFSVPKGEKNVTASQNIEVADAKGSHPSKFNYNRIKNTIFLTFDIFAGVQQLT